MQRTLVNFWLDVTLLVLFLSNFWLCFVIRFIFPPGTTADGWLLWGWTYDRWRDFQFGLSCGFALAVLVHVMLHWSWVCGVITSRLLRARDGRRRQWSEGAQTLYGVGVIVLIFHVLAFGFAAALLTVQSQ